MLLKFLVTQSALLKLQQLDSWVSFSCCHCKVQISYYPHLQTNFHTTRMHKYTPHTIPSLQPCRDTNTCMRAHMQWHTEVLTIALYSPPYCPLLIKELPTFNQLRGMYQPPEGHMYIARVNHQRYICVHVQKMPV